MTTQNIYSALLSVQSEMPKIDKDGKNPHFKNSYATLPNVLSTVLPLMNKNNLVLTAIETSNNDTEYLKIIITLIDNGQSIESNVKLINVADMQKLGSAYTYALRYGLLAMLGISPDLDDDGNSVSLPNNKQPPKQEQQPEPPKDVKLTHPKIDTQELFYLKKTSLSQEKIEKAEKVLQSGSNAELNGLHTYLLSL